MLFLFDGIDFFDGDNLRVYSLLFSLSCGLFLFLLINIFLNYWGAFFVWIFINFSLFYGNAEKIAHTGEPLSFSDLNLSQNISVVFHYFKNWHFLFLMLFALCFFVVLKISARFEGKILIRNIFLSLFLLPFVFHLNFSRFHPEFNKWDNILYQNFDVFYRDWDMHHDYRRNGLLLHLMHTSWAQLPSYKEDDRIVFESLMLENKHRDDKFDNSVFYIQCESCWYDENNFKDLFQPLIDIGMSEFNMIAPGYGGGTVNSSFEILTGLPVDQVLNGIIYQEYYKKLSDKAFSLPRAFVDNGYSAYAFHNFYDNFWRRNVVMPKLGFKKFYGLSSMNNDKAYSFPRDRIMFDKFFDVYKGGKGFYFFETVHSHGAYKNVEDYREKISRTVEDIKIFVEKILLDNKNNIVVIYADHKPTLNEFFASKNLLSDKNEVGRVPFLIKANGAENIEEFISRVNGRPMFCFSGLLSEYYLNLSIPAFEFSKSVCSKEYKRGGAHQSHPSWLYHYSLFD